MVDVELATDPEEWEIVETVGQENMPGPAQELVSRTLTLQKFWLSIGPEYFDGSDGKIKQKEAEVDPVDQRVAHECHPRLPRTEFLRVEVEGPLPG